MTIPYQDVRQDHQHTEPEISATYPGPLQPNREEEGGEGEDVDDGGEAQEPGGEGLRCRQSQQGVKSEDDA